MVIADEILEKVPEKYRESLMEILSQDPRPSYQKDPERIYGMSYGGFEIKFMVDNGILTVTEIE